jgi:Ca2+-binding EF-hand superfamily protein
VANSALCDTQRQDEKRSKVVKACQKIDEMKLGMVKSSVFFQLLDCMDFNLSSEQRQDMLCHFGVKSHGQTFVKYQALLKSLNF